MNLNFIENTNSLPTYFPHTKNKQFDFQTGAAVRANKHKRVSFIQKKQSDTHIMFHTIRGNIFFYSQNENISFVNRHARDQRVLHNTKDLCLSVYRTRIRAARLFTRIDFFHVKVNENKKKSGFYEGGSSFCSSVPLTPCLLVQRVDERQTPKIQLTIICICM